MVATTGAVDKDIFKAKSNAEYSERTIAVAARNAFPSAAAAGAPNQGLIKTMPRRRTTKLGKITLKL